MASTPDEVLKTYADQLLREWNQRLSRTATAEQFRELAEALDALDKMGHNVVGVSCAAQAGLNAMWENLATSSAQEVRDLAVAAETFHRVWQGLQTAIHGSADD